MFETLYSQLGAVPMLLAVGFAFWKGEEIERMGAATYLLAWLATMLIQDDGPIMSWIYGVLAIDVVVTLVFAGLAWKASRAWPYWAAGFSLLAVIGHITAIMHAMAGKGGGLVDAYLTVLTIASYGIVASIAVGAFWAWQERRAAGLE